MKLSISNIAWSAENDLEMYDFLSQEGFTLEIAPTRIFENNPYEDLSKASRFQKDLLAKYGFGISSMQSICFGRSEAIFGSEEERKAIFHYTLKAIDFASAIDCNNLVFGSPKNRIIGENQMEIAYDFFKGLGKYAESKNTIMALEANPEIYGTNFITTTQQAFDFVKEANCPGLMVNVDLGTILNNNESLEILEKNLKLVNHIHISEPYLERIVERKIHEDLAKMLVENKYDKFVSIEMKNQNSIESVKETANYIKSIFHVT